MTAQHGVIHFLAMIHQMELGAAPAIIGNGGRIIKQEADNLFAGFEQPAQALEAALDIFRAFDAMNTVLPEERAIRVSIGIGYGDLLVIEDADMFGHEMNAACKLGEDVAAPMEVLLTPAAYHALPAQRYDCSPDSVMIGTLRHAYFRYQRCLYPRSPTGNRLAD